MKRPLRDHWPWLLLLAGLPPAAIGLLLLPNDYRAWGGSGIDCDGPFLLAFSLPAASLSMAAAVIFARRALRKGGMASFLPFLLCMTLVLALGPNSCMAVRELQRPDRQASCD